MFFLIRLALAPCVEATILLDRKLYLVEQGESAIIDATIRSAKAKGWTKM